MPRKLHHFRAERGRVRGPEVELSSTDVSPQQKDTECVLANELSFPAEP